MTRNLFVSARVPDRFLKRQEIGMSSKAGILIKVAVLLLAGAWQCDVLAAAPKTLAAEDVNQTTVHFEDLNLDHPAGAAELYRRIQRAAVRVCGDPQLPGSRLESLDWRRCVTQAVDRAVVALDRPALTAYYREQTTRPRIVAGVSRIAAKINGE
jgi:UrcA family protein